MKDNKIKYSKDAVMLLKNGVDKLANAVKSTLGPSGKNVIIIENNKPKITKDGVSVAKSVNLEDIYENAGAQIVKEVAEKTLKNVGDNTTTATVLAQSMIELGIKAMLKGVNPIDLKNGIDLTVKKVVEILQNYSIDINKNSQELLQVATISANNDNEVGSIVCDAIKKIGEDGIITIEESEEIKTEVDYVDGVQYDRGFLNEFFVNNNEKRICRLENPYILFYYGRMADTEMLAKAFNVAFQQSRPLVVIAKDVYGNAIYNMEYNKHQCLAIQADGTAGYKKKYMEDLAVVTGGGVFEERDIFDANKLGQCDTVIAYEYKTIFIGGKGKEDEIERQAQLVRKQIEETKDEYIKQIIKKRLARIKGGIATIKVGGYTDLEKKEKYDRFDDAVCAAQAALKEGVIVGGGVAYFKAVDSLYFLKPLTKGERIGVGIVCESLLAPIRQIIRNCGKNDKKILKQLMKVDNFDFGYNARSNKIEDLKEAGIIDATMAVRVALENAASIAGLFLTTECIVNNNNDEQSTFIS